MFPTQQRSSFEEPVGNCGAGLGIQEEEQGSRKHSCLEGQGKGPLVLPAVQWDTSLLVLGLLAPLVVMLHGYSTRRTVIHS